MKDADDTTDPTDASDPIITIYAKNYFINEDKAGAIDGPAAEDEENTLTFGFASSETVQIA